MNYCIVAFAVWMIISMIQWFVDGKKNYSGPNLDVEAMKTGEVQGMDPVTTHGTNGSHRAYNADKTKEV